MEPRAQGPWDHGTLGPWEEPWDTGTLGHWDPGTLGPWAPWVELYEHLFFSIQGKTYLKVCDLGIISNHPI